MCSWPDAHKFSHASSIPQLPASSGGLCTPVTVIFGLEPSGLQLSEQQVTHGVESWGRSPEALGVGFVKAASDTFSIGIKNCKHFLVKRKPNKS